MTFHRRPHVRLLSLLLLAYFASLPQTLGQIEERTAQYKSEIDVMLNLNRVSVLSVQDNMDGIYAKALERHLKKMVEEHYRWTYVETPEGFVLSDPLEEYENDSSKILALKDQFSVDGLFAVRLTKGPRGVMMRLDLFLMSDGRIFVQENLRNHPRFEIAELEKQLENLFQSTLHKIPFGGRILSRQGNRVTLNMGRRDGLKIEDSITAIQIIGLKRHPKFQFVVQTEKEILGRIKILKVDDTLSFGAVVVEKEKGAVGVGTKLSSISEVEYKDADSLLLGKESENILGGRVDSQVSYGENPKEWVPEDPPSYGELSVALGFGSFGNNVSLSSENLHAGSSLYPNMSLQGELWLTPHWITKVSIRQGVVNVPNPRSGAEPGTLALAHNNYSVKFGYNLLMTDEFFGPKLVFLGGYAVSTLYVDSSTPTVLTTMEYSGLELGIRGSLPISKKGIWSLGAELTLVLNPQLTERPVTSGDSSSSQINQFTFFGAYKMSEHMLLTGSLDFQLYSSSFSGSGTRSDGQSASSTSQTFSSLNGGIRYLF